MLEHDMFPMSWGSATVYISQKTTEPFGDPKDEADDDIKSSIKSNNNKSNGIKNSGIKNSGNTSTNSNGSANGSGYRQSDPPGGWPGEAGETE